MNPIEICKRTFSRTKTRGLSKAPPFATGKANGNSTAFFALITGILLIAVLSGQALAAGGMTPDAEKILRSMSEFMGKMSAFSVEADIDNEIVDRQGQKLQFSSSAKIVLKRPDKFYASRQGGIVYVDFIFDGKVLTLYGRNLDVYYQKDSSGTIDKAIETLHDSIGLDTPGADLLYSDAYSTLSEGILSGAYMGTSYVNGVECHYLAFREPHVDWQLWISAEGDPLPMKYVISTKWITGSPQYSIRFRNWNTSPKIEPAQFNFKAPKGAKKLEDLVVNNMGELVVEEGER